MKTFFISDFHLGHAKIIGYTNRPFNSLEEMDSTIINNFNSRVKEDDLVYYCGDFCFKYAPGESATAPKRAFEHYRTQLKCKNIIFLNGNHDERNGNKSDIESMVINHGGKRLFLTHNPKFAKKEFYWNICGHTHGKYGKFTKLDTCSYIVDVSVENWNFFPIDINQINGAFQKWLREKNEPIH